MKLFQMIVLFLSLFAFFSPGAASADEKAVTVRGEAVIYNGNIPQARERALQEAFSEAIMQVMGTYITAESYTQNYVAIDRSVLTKTRGYVKAYEILEAREQPDSLDLKVSVSVSNESIKDDLTALGILLDAMGNPVIEMTGKDQGLEASESVSVFKRMMTAKGFYVSDKDAGGPPDVTIQIGGKITNRTHAGNTGFYGAVAEVTARAVRTGTKNLIASESAVSNGAGLSESAALKQAYQQAAESLVPKLVAAVSERWSREISEGKNISLAVKADVYDKVHGFTKYLGRLFGVKKVDLKSYKDGEARYLVRFAGQSRTLTDLMMRMPPEKMKVSVNGLDADSVQLNIH